MDIGEYNITFEFEFKNKNLNIYENESNNDSSMYFEFQSSQNNTYPYDYIYSFNGKLTVKEMKTIIIASNETLPIITLPYYYNLPIYIPYCRLKINIDDYEVYNGYTGYFPSMHYFSTKINGEALDVGLHDIHIEIIQESHEKYNINMTYDNSKISFNFNEGETSKDLVNYIYTFDTILNITPLNLNISKIKNESDYNITFSENITLTCNRDCNLIVFIDD